METQKSIAKKTLKLKKELGIIKFYLTSDDVKNRDYYSVLVDMESRGIISLWVRIWGYGDCSHPYPANNFPSVPYYINKIYEEDGIEAMPEDFSSDVYYKIEDLSLLESLLVSD